MADAHTSDGPVWTLQEKVNPASIITYTFDAPTNTSASLFYSGQFRTVALSGTDADDQVSVAEVVKGLTGQDTTVTFAEGKWLIAIDGGLETTLQLTDSTDAPVPVTVDGQDIYNGEVNATVASVVQTVRLDESVNSVIKLYPAATHADRVEIDSSTATTESIQAALDAILAARADVTEVSVVIENGQWFVSFTSPNADLIVEASSVLSLPPAITLPWQAYTITTEQVDATVLITGDNLFSALSSSAVIIPGSGASQAVDLGFEIDGLTPTGLANDSTAYTVTLLVNNRAAQTITVIGSAAQDYAQLLAELNANTEGAVWSMVDGDLVVAIPVETNQVFQNWLMKSHWN